MSNILSTLRRKAITATNLLRWKAYRAEHARHRVVLGTPDPTLPTNVESERHMQQILGSPQVTSFLEIGIGPGPHFDRMKLMADRQIDYVGCDFSEVCDFHRRELQTASIHLGNVRFRGNDCGTYAWTLLELLREGRQFDVVYLDGHHTFYVDAPAVVLADQLLKPGGHFLVDDVCWTLSLVIENMKNNFSEWRFYRRMYDFDQYTPEQLEMPHIGILADELLVKRLRYKRVDEFSTGYWWTLRKPE